jgi:hypothetical protein
MKRLLFVSALLTFIAVAFSLCSKGSYAFRRRHFMYPDATLIVESGSIKKTIPIVETSYRTWNDLFCVRYAGGYTFDTGACSLVGVCWQDLPWRCLSCGNSAPRYEKRRGYVSFVQGCRSGVGEIRRLASRDFARASAGATMSKPRPNQSMSQRPHYEIS